ncbi:autotransporter outer membrane beta-barrel domain-containing protein [Salmonella enterica]|nr:autotransporter outer membrane beta-barrel domain-containing protein [Salmonella enterica subsp. enterica serovar Java]EBV8393105.1 autotransporter outer membrane beta-barrel domain-containing protein [Salmonella enterica subsp. enterica serovar Virchow]EJM3429944.1 autotransporter outer membrane beta-barrel domain-containing protein [Salmonella enterica]
MRNIRLHSLVICISLSLNSQVYASTVRNDIPYQIYRDFAENKGVFQPGALNIPVYDNKGNLAGILNKAPMPDFSSVDSSIGVATLIDPQHVVSVKHNGGYSGVIFGGKGSNPDYHRTTYQLVSRNNAPEHDFHAPRLNKLVTEVVPATMTNSFVYGAYIDAARFPVFYRIGSGTQYTKAPDGNRHYQSAAYVYLTGGTVGRPVISDWSFVSGTEDVFSPRNGPLGTYGESGDSGSPLFAWDTQRNHWVLVGVLDSEIPNGNRWNILQADFIKRVLSNENTAPAVILQNKAQIEWSFDKSTGNGALTTDSGSTGTSWSMHGKEGNNADAGKNLFFYGEDGRLLLKDDVDQGAGALTFGADYVVSSEAGKTWKGAGLIINPNVKVTWQINGVAGDSLHKTGAGTLLVQGTGVNTGALSVGDGTVILDQRADAFGKKEVFSTIDIVSGRPTVVLSDAGQIDPGKIYFGYRGGRLDLNGNDISLSRLKAADNGAIVVNHNTDKNASVMLTGNGINNTNTDQIFMGVFGETDSTLANGELNIHYRPPSEKGYLAMTGGSNVNGTLFIDNGNVLLSGAPLLHASNVYMDDWTSSGFIFSKIDIAGGKGLQIGQYTTVLADINAQADSHVVVGYHHGNDDKNNTRKCTVNDNTGVTTCTTPVLTEAACAALPYSSLTGDIKLADNASLTLGKAIYNGAVQGASGSVIHMTSDSRWLMTADSATGGLIMKNGASVALSEPDDTGHGNTLIVQGNLSGSGNFNLHTQVAGKTGDRIIVNGLASGNYTLTVRDDGRDPAPDGWMQGLMSLTNRNQDFSKVNVTLTGGYSDIGAYRYRLMRQNSDYMLYNPLVPWQPLVPPVSAPDSGQESGQPSVPPVSVPGSDQESGQPSVPPVSAPGSVQESGQQSVPPVFVPDSGQESGQPSVPMVSAPGNAQANWISHGANTAISDFTSHFNLLSQQGESTEHYLSNLKPGQNGLWATLRANDLHYGNSSYRSYCQKLINQSLGADWQRDTPGGALQWGGVLSNTVSHATFDENAGARDSVSGMNLYGKFTFNSGLWLSGYAGAHYLNYSLKDNSTTERNGMLGYVAGLGVGYTWQNVGGLSLRPEAGVSLYGLPSGNYTLNSTLRVSEGAVRTTQYHAGLQVSQEMMVAGIPNSLFAKISYRMNPAAVESVCVNQHKLDANLYRSRTELTVGNEFAFGEVVQLNVKGGYTAGGGLKGSKDFSATLKYNF